MATGQTGCSSKNEDKAAALKAKYAELFGTDKADSRHGIDCINAKFEVFSLYQNPKLTYSAGTDQ